MIVRSEREADHAGIATVVAAAFGSPVEAKLVDDLRASPGYVPELALVGEEGGVVGHGMFTVTHLEGGAAILMLSPLAIRPDRQRRGIGSALVHEGLRRAARRDEPFVVVEGDPRYYSRFGFRRATELGLERPHEAVPEWAFQALALSDGALPSGRVTYPPPFDGL